MVRFRNIRNFKLEIFIKELRIFVNELRIFENDLVIYSEINYITAFVT